jgi:hypothetical protein
MLDKFIYFALLALLVVTPLPYGAVESWSIALWEIGVFGVIGLWALLAVQQGKLDITFNPLAWPMLGLLVVAIIQILPNSTAGRSTISFSPFATSQFAIKLFASTCFLLLFATFVNTDERRATAVKAIIAVCTLIALIGIGQRYGGKLIWQRGTFGPFVNRNHFAGFLEMGVGLAGGLMLGRTVKREWLAIYGSCALVMCAGIGLSASRGGVLALAAEVVFLALLAIPAFFSSRRSAEKDGPRRAGVLIRAVATLLIGAGAVANASAGATSGTRQFKWLKTIRYLAWG